MRRAVGRFLASSPPWAGWIAVLVALASSLQAQVVTPQAFSREPFLQNTTPSGVTIVWRTRVLSGSRIEYGTTRNLGSVSASPGWNTHHHVTLQGLASDTTYLYRVRSPGADGGAEVVSTVESFRTFKQQGAVRFVFVGDTGQNSAAQFFNAAIMAALMPDLVLHGGDIIYGGFTDTNADSMIFAQYLKYSGQMRHTPFFFAVGNHDLNCCEGDRGEWNPTNMVLNAPHFQSTFHLPTNSATGTEHFYSFDHGDVHFVALYNPWFAQYEFTQTRLQYQWFTNDLANTSKPWKVVFLHHPLATSGAHALDDYNHNGVADQHEILQIVGGAARTYGVQLILTAHDHDYERFSPIAGLHTVVSGGGGAGLHSLIQRHPLSSQYIPANHCLNVEIAGSTATVQALGTNGMVLDSWIIHREPPPDRTYYSAWNSPVVEVGIANDGDGNIRDQVFDFQGDPILGRHGSAANLGWFYVNNDATHLFIGLAGVMIPKSANLFLFIDAPGRTGTTTMAGLGNGVIDPSGEGADGLDCLENLSFVGFQPSVGVVLGDEYADGTVPGFRRPGMDFATGQGAFYLAPGFSPVPGVRIQQYNRSPQVNSWFIESTGTDLEQDADFIEVAVPLSALGAVSPGETVRLAVLAGLGGHEPGAMTRSLDTALVGTALQSGPGGLASLSPVRVRLAYPVDLDTDADGLSDTWELAHGLRPDSGAGEHGGEGDPDGDQATNLIELLSGTDPSDPGSVLKLTLSLAGSERNRLEWPIVPGASYLLEAATDPASAFQMVRRVRSNNRTHLMNRAIFDLPTGPDSLTQRSYRVRLER